MKVGILTFHRVLNYGAELQAYALQKFLELNGYDSYIVDYWPEYRVRSLRLFSFKYFFSMGNGQKLIYIKNHLPIFRYLRRLYNSNTFIKRYLKVSKDYNYDALVCGSDQIWRKIFYPPYNDYDETYFGAGYYKAPLIISYAASMGHVKFKNEADEVKFNTLLKGVNKISVREPELKRYIEDKTSRDCKLVLDPIFLLSKEQWMSLIDTTQIPEEKYVLYYNHQGLKITDDFVLNIANEKKLKVIEVDPGVTFNHRSSRYQQTANAQTFLSLIYGAEYVVSSSFHGFALAIRLEKQVYYASNPSKANRLENLAHATGLEDRCINGNEETSQINYNSINLKVNELEKESRSWLLNALQ